MDAGVKAALDRGGLIDMTTTGRKSGKPHRIELGFLQLDGHYYITGMPGRRRDWLANLEVEPNFTIHLKRGLQADVPVVARIITDDDERAEVLYKILVDGWGNPISKADHILPTWVAGAPLIEFNLTDA